MDRRLATRRCWSIRCAGDSAPAARSARGRAGCHARLGRELSLARVGVSEMAESPDDRFDAVVLIAQEVAELGL
jgi:hypothetical protein